MTSVLTTAAEAPVVTLIRCTMPDLGSDPARRSRLLTSLLPVTAPLFFVFMERFLGVNSLITPAGAAYGAVCGLMGSASLYIAWPHVKYSRVMNGILTVVAFVISVTWMDGTAGNSSTLLTALGKIHGVSETLLGATVLAWGNSVGDIVADITVARRVTRRWRSRRASRARCSTCSWVSPLGLVIATEEHGTITGMHLENELVVLAGALLVSLSFQAIATPLMHKWRHSRGMAIASLSYYLVFSVVYALISVGVLFPGTGIDTFVVYLTRSAARTPIDVLLTHAALATSRNASTSPYFSRIMCRASVSLIGCASSRSNSLCQCRFRWLMNQLLICVWLRPASFCRARFASSLG